MLEFSLPYEIKIRDEMIATLEAATQKLEATNQDLQEEVKWLKAKIEAMSRRLFGSSSERLTQEDLRLFIPGLEDTAGAVYQAPEVITTTRTIQRVERTGGVRARIPDHLERVEVVVIPPEVQAAPEDFQEISRDTVTQRLDYRPGKIICKRYILPKYKDLRPHGTIVQASAPPTVEDKMLAEPGLVGHVLLQKYEMHLPYYRQSKEYREKYGVDLHRNLLGEWGHAASLLLEPIYDAMVRHVQSASYLQVDETPVKYQDPESKGKTEIGQLWVYHVVGGEVVFSWRTDRSRLGPEGMLKNYRGYVQTDAYSVYGALEKSRPDLMFVGCMAHARRKFYTAKDEDPAALWFLEKIGKLYEIERELREAKAPPEQREKERREKAAPLMTEIKMELDQALPLIVPKSHFGLAVSYAHKNWLKLERYLTQGKLEIDNNLCENAIRPTAVGKKNWLFFGSPEAGDRGAILYSLLGSCRRLGINPHEYLADVLARLPSMKIRGLEELEPLTPSGWLKAKG